MGKVYKFKGKTVYESEVAQAAKEKGVSIDEFIRSAGIEVSDGSNGKPAVYVFRDKDVTEDEIAQAAQESGVSFDEMVRKIGAKKKDGGTTAGQSESLSESEPPQSQQPKSDNNAWRNKLKTSLDQAAADFGGAQEKKPQIKDWATISAERLLATPARERIAKYKEAKAAEANRQDEFQVNQTFKPKIDLDTETEIVQLEKELDENRNTIINSLVVDAPDMMFDEERVATSLNTNRVRQFQTIFGLVQKQLRVAGLPTMDPTLLSNPDNFPKIAKMVSDYFDNQITRSQVKPLYGSGAPVPGVAAGVPELEDTPETLVLREKKQEFLNQVVVPMYAQMVIEKNPDAQPSFYGKEIMKVADPKAAEALAVAPDLKVQNYTAERIGYEAKLNDLLIRKEAGQDVQAQAVNVLKEYDNLMWKYPEIRKNELRKFVYESLAQKGEIGGAADSKIWQQALGELDRLMKNPLDPRDIPLLKEMSDDMSIVLDLNLLNRTYKGVRLGENKFNEMLEPYKKGIEEAENFRGQGVLNRFVYGFADAGSDIVKGARSIFIGDKTKLEEMDVEALSTKRYIPSSFKAVEAEKVLDVRDGSATRGQEIYNEKAGDFNWSGMPYSMGEGAGQLAMQVVAGELTGGLATGAAGLAGKTISGAAMANTKLFLPSFLMTYDQNSKRALELFGAGGDNGWKRSVYTVVTSALEGATEKIGNVYEQLGIGKAAKEGMQKLIADDIAQLSIDQIKKMGQEGLKKWANKVVRSSLNAVKTAGKNQGSEIVEELANNVGEYLTAAILDPSAVEGRNLFEELTETAQQTFASMGFLGVMGGAKGAVTGYSNSSLSKQGMVRIANDPEKYKTELAKQKASQELSEQEYNEKVRLVNTLSKARQDFMSVADIVKSKSDSPQQYAANLEQFVQARANEIALLKEVEKGGIGEAQKKALQKQISKWQKVQETLLDKKVNFDDMGNPVLPAFSTSNMVEVQAETEQGEREHLFVQVDDDGKVVQQNLYEDTTEQPEVAEAPKVEQPEAAPAQQPVGNRLAGRFALQQPQATPQAEQAQAEPPAEAAEAKPDAAKVKEVAKRLSELAKWRDEQNAMLRRTYQDNPDPDAWIEPYNKMTDEYNQRIEEIGVLAGEAYPTMPKAKPKAKPVEEAATAASLKGIRNDDFVRKYMDEAEQDMYAAAEPEAKAQMIADKKAEILSLEQPVQDGITEASGGKTDTSEPATNATQTAAPSVEVQPKVAEVVPEKVQEEGVGVGGDKKTNTVNGYEFTKTPTLENVIVEPIDKSNNAIIENQMFVDENKNVLAEGVKYVGGGWYEIGRDNFGSVDLYNTVTKEGVSLNHKQGGRMGVVVQDFIKNNSRYNENIAVRGSKFTEAEHNPKFGGSGHYKGTYFYVGLNAESKALEHGKNLTKVDISDANLYELGEKGQTTQSLKKEAKKEGYDTRDASGYAESEYLKKQGYDGIKRGNEIILFEPKKFEVKAAEQSLKETPQAGSVVGGDVVKAGGNRVVHAGNELISSIDDTKLQSRDSGEYGKGFYVSKTETNQPYYGKVKSYFDINEDAKTLNENTFDIEDWKRKETEKSGYKYEDVLKEPEKYDYEDLLKIKSFEDAVNYDKKGMNDYARKKGFDVFEATPDEIVILNKNAVKPVEQPQKETPQAGSVGVGGDVESTTKSLEKAMPKDEGISVAVTALPTKGTINYKDVLTVTGTKNPFQRYFNNPDALNEKAKKIYNQLIKGEKLNNEKILLDENNKILDGTHRMQARMAMGETDFKYSNPSESFFKQPFSKTIAEAYHKAKKDGSNPELVKAVEQSLKETPQAGSVGVGGDMKFTAKGGNKVVDEKGEPLVVYHGTNKEFDKLDADKPQRGLFFTKDKQTAKGYANKKGDGSGTVREAKISLKNPHIIDAKGKSYDEIIVDLDKVDMATGKGVSKKMTTDEIVDALRGKRSEKIVTSLYGTKEKADGIIIKNVKDNFTKQGEPTDIYIPFSNEQISEQSLKETPQAGSVGVGGEVDLGKNTIIVNMSLPMDSGVNTGLVKNSKGAVYHDRNTSKLEKLGYSKEQIDKLSQAELDEILAKNIENPNVETSAKMPLAEKQTTTQEFLNEANKEGGRFAELAKALKQFFGIDGVETEIVKGLKDFFGKNNDGDYANNKIRIDEKAKNKLQTFLHEAIHKVTVDKLLQFERGDYSKLSKQDIEAIQALTRIFNESKVKIHDFLGGGKGDRTKGHYGFTNVHEFISEAFTNPEFQSLLKNLPTEGNNPTIFKQFLDAVAKFLGLKDASILNDIFYYTENLNNKAVEQSLKETPKAETPTNAPKPTPTVSEPAQPITAEPSAQIEEGTQEGVQPSVDIVGEGVAEGAAAVPVEEQEPKNGDTVVIESTQTKGVINYVYRDGAWRFLDSRGKEQKETKKKQDEITERWMAAQGLRQLSPELEQAVAQAKADFPDVTVQEIVDQIKVDNPELVGTPEKLQDVQERVSRVLEPVQTQAQGMGVLRNAIVKGRKGLREVFEKMFAATAEQADAAAVIADRIISSSAKLLGITKKEMYSRIVFNPSTATQMGALYQQKEKEYDIDGYSVLKELEQSGGYVITDIKMVDDSFDKDEPEHERTKAYRLEYAVEWSDADTSSDPDVEAFDNIDDAYNEAQIAGTYWNKYSNHSKSIVPVFREVWLNTDGTEYEETGDSVRFQELYWTKELEPIANRFGFTKATVPSYVYYKDFGTREDDAVRLEQDALNRLGKDLSGKMTATNGGVYTTQHAGSGKYSRIDVLDADGNELGSVQLRIADHTYNPRNNDADALDGRFISVEIANVNETKDKFATAYSLRFDGSNSYEDVLKATKERLDEIIGEKIINQTGERLFQAQQMQSSAAAVVDGFYSPIEKRVLDFKQDKVTANKWLTIIGTGDEAKWTGVADWLKSLPPSQSVSKGDILRWMQDNRVKIEVTDAMSDTEKYESGKKSISVSYSTETGNPVSLEVETSVDADGKKVLTVKGFSAASAKSELHGIGAMIVIQQAVAQGAERVSWQDSDSIFTGKVFTDAVRQMTGQPALIDGSVVTETGTVQQAINITDQIKDAVKNGLPLFQNAALTAQGAITFQNSNWIVQALTNPNVTTPLHELSHGYFDTLIEAANTGNEQAEADVRQVLDEIGLSDVQTSQVRGNAEVYTKAQEFYARGFERYLRDGKAPVPEMQGLFDRFRNWLMGIYKSLAGSPINVQLSPKMREVYGRMLGADKVAEDFPKLAPVTYQQEQVDLLREIRNKQSSLTNPVVIAREMDALKQKYGADQVELAKFIENNFDAIVAQIENANLLEKEC